MKMETPGTSWYCSIHNSEELWDRIELQMGTPSNQKINIQKMEAPGTFAHYLYDFSDDFGMNLGLKQGRLVHEKFDE